MVFADVLPRLMWPLTVYEVPLSKVERMEKIINYFVRKWLGVPRCLSIVALYGKGIVELPISSLTEEFKCAKVRLGIYSYSVQVGTRVCDSDSSRTLVALT